MMVCPACDRPVALARPRCLYCGAALPREVLRGEAPAASEPPPPAQDRTLVILELAGVDPSALAGALGLTYFEAAQRGRRGGLELWRSLPPSEAEAEVTRLAGHGIRALAIPESGVRQACRPIVATGGRLEGSILTTRTEGGALRMEGRDVLLLVHGEIRRHYAPDAEVRRSRTATLDAGHRMHLHLVASTVPVEIDPGSFDFGETPLGRSSLLTLLEWVRAVAPSAPTDDSFKREVPALAPSEGDLVGPAAAARALQTPRSAARAGRDAPVVLDNLAQFRFYSAWRGAAERVRAPGLHG
jgi:hypothetical protein